VLNHNFSGHACDYHKAMNLVCKAMNLVNINWWTLWATYLFLPKTFMRIFYHDGIHYWTAHK